MSLHKKDNGCLIASLLVGLVVIGMIAAGFVAYHLGGNPSDTGRRAISSISLTTGLNQSA